MSAPTVTFPERDSPQWNAAWSALAAHPLNVGLEEPTAAHFEGERWQLMGLESRGGAQEVVLGARMHRRGRVEGPCWVFRHRRHPRVDGRVYLRFPGPAQAGEEGAAPF